MGIPEGAVYRRILETIQEERLSGKIGGEQAERQRARDLWNALKQER
jgi:hypothetical protein